METFTFDLFEKVEVWCKTEFEIEANSLEEAKEKAIKYHKEGKTTSISWEVDVETITKLNPIDNGGSWTEEIIDEYGDIIWDNSTL
jgi:hypothetical protein